MQLFEREAKDRLTAEASTLGFPVGQAPKEFVIPDYPADFGIDWLVSEPSHVQARGADRER
jgi:hypothetical protein